MTKSLWRIELRRKKDLILHIFLILPPLFLWLIAIRIFRVKYLYFSNFPSTYIFKLGLLRTIDIKRRKIEKEAEETENPASQH